jgi:S-adenosylmethionine hydrolase
LTVACEGRHVQGIISTYGAAMAQELVALFDSQGRLELAVVQGNAARELGVGPGAEVRIDTGS